MRKKMMISNNWKTGLFACIGVTMIFHSCKEDSLFSPDSDGLTLIEVKTAGVGGMPTRGYADAYNNSLPSGSQIDVFIYDDTGADISITFAGSPTTWVYRTNGEVDAVTGKSALVKVSPSEYVDYFAVYPHTEGVTPSTSSYNFSVQTDQTTQENILKSELITNDITNCPSEDARSVNLALKHRMAKVLVQFVPTGEMKEENLPDMFYVTNICPTVTIDPQEGTIDTGNSQTTTLTAARGQAFFLPPQTIQANSQFLKFDLKAVGGADTGIKNVTFTPTSSITFNANTCYVLSLKLDLNYIKLTGSIKDWTAETLAFDKIIL